MIYVFIVMFVLLMMPLWLLRKYERQFVWNRTSSKNLLRLLYPAGLFLFDCWYRRYGKSSRQLQWAEAVYIDDVPKEQMRIRGARRVVRLWLCLIAAAAAGILFAAKSLNETQETAEFLPRPGIGETEVYELEVTGIGQESIDVAVTVSGIQPEDEVLQEIFDNAFDHVVQEILGENRSLEEVRTNLELISVTDYGIRVQWESLQPELISSRGKIVAEALPESGEIATLRVTLSYGTYQTFYDLSVHLMPPKKDASYYYDLLLQKLDEGDRRGRKNDGLELPEILEGKEVSFFYRKEKQPWSVLFLTVLAGVLLVAADYQNMKKEYEERSQQLLRDYPSLLFKLSVMLGCGITLRGAWSRIVEGYQEEKKRTALRYVYEEMVAVQRRIDAGDGETAAYLMFGQRCGAECYLRLGTYLDQNVRQGISGMQSMLETEMNHALEERRNLALRLGEAMNTRLLLPMFLMLGVVIVILMTPAMLSM